MTARSHTLRPASERDLSWVWLLARGQGGFESIDDVRRAWAAAPWQVQVSDAKDAALLTRWRDHLGLLAVIGLWCAERTVPAHMVALRAIARAHGFDDVLSPLVPEDAIDQFLRAGMRVVHSGVAMAARQCKEIEPARTEGVTFELATDDDLDALLAVDILCFNDFWRYDARLMTEYLKTDRTLVARVGDEVVGYAMCRIASHEGIIGRLAVVPVHRGRGIGTALFADTVRYLRRQGVHRFVLYTQADNEEAQRLYARLGFEVSGPGRCFLAFGDVAT